MEGEPEALGSPVTPPSAQLSDFANAYSFVVQFLQSQGLQATEASLLREINEHCSSPPADAVNTVEVPDFQQAIASTSPAVSHGGSAAFGGARGAERGQTGDMQIPYLFQQPSRTSRKVDRAAQRKFLRQRAPWDEDVDEYSDSEDAGYLRKDVVGQSTFEELEIQLQEGSGTEQHFFTHAKSRSSPDEDDDEDEEEDEGGDGDEENEASDSSEGSLDLAPHSQSGAGLHQELGVLFGSSSGRVADETWDLGPKDIKIAEPVTTPTKTSERNTDEPKPVLSRVESLSSSFVDFDIERNLDEEGGTGLSAMPSGHNSGNVSEVDLCFSPSPSSLEGAGVRGGSEAQPEVIDFHPRPLAEVTPQDLADLSSEPASQPAVNSFSPAIKEEGFSIFSPAAWAAVTSAGAAEQSLALLTNRGQRADDGKEQTGGFSFPVTSPKVEPEPEARMFKSWPSVRSSCTSEVIGPSDDDHTAADYADDEYSRSVSKPNSRSPSQNLSESGYKSAGLEEGDVIAPGRRTWAFNQRQVPSSPDNKKGSVRKEPSLFLDKPGHKGSCPGNGMEQRDGTSSISEPGEHIDLQPGKRPLGGPLAKHFGSIPKGSVSAPVSVKNLSSSAEPSVIAGITAPSGNSLPCSAGDDLMCLTTEERSGVGESAECLGSEDSRAGSMSALGETAGKEGCVPDANQSADQTPAPLPEMPSQEKKGAALVSVGSLRHVVQVPPAPPAPDDDEEVLLGKPTENISSPSKPRLGDQGADELVAHMISLSVDSGPVSPTSPSHTALPHPGKGGQTQTPGTPESAERAEQPDAQHVQPAEEAKGEGEEGSQPLFVEEETLHVAQILRPQGDSEERQKEQQEQGSPAPSSNIGCDTGHLGNETSTAAAAAMEWQPVSVEQEHVTRRAPSTSIAGNGTSGVAMPRYTVDESGAITYEFDEEYIRSKYEVFSLRVYHRRQRTGFEETKDFPIRLNDLIAGRYQVMDFLGSAAFSRAVQAVDTKTGMLVCLKIIKNNKDYFDQSLDEIKLLKYVNQHDPDDSAGVVRLYDYFYYKEHLFLVCELLRANLYEFQKYNRESGDPPYFTNARIQRIAKQVLGALAYIHSLGLIHSDLKPENILIKSYSRCEVKVIDLGSSCFITDQLSSYVQSRSYRAPEVILGLPYDQKVDVWSLGCILAELSSGFVLLQNDSLSTLLARMEGILGPVPSWMVRKGRYAPRFYTRSGQLFERNTGTERYELLIPKRTSLKHRAPEADDGLLDFIASLLCVDPNKRPTAAEALHHPWLHQTYSSLES